MPAITLFNFAIFVLAYAAYFTLSRLYRSHRIARFASRHGAVQAPNVSARFPLSLVEPYLRIVGMVRKLKAGQDLLDDVFASEFVERKTWQRLEIGATPRIGTLEPANLQAMLATQFEDFEVGRMRHNQLGPMLGSSIFTSDGSFWQHSRALFRPQFNRENINNLESTDLAATALVEALGPLDAGNWTANVELLPLLYNFTLDTSTEFLFGESVGSQAVAIEKQQQQRQGSYATRSPKSSSAAHEATSKQFMSDFALVSEMAIHRIRNQNLYFLADGWAFRRACYNIQRFTTTFVERALAASSSAVDKSAADRSRNLLAALATQTRDRAELRNQALAILFAGRDTTASLLAWSLTRLALHPDVLTRLRAAILREFGGFGGGNGDKAATTPTFLQLKGCRALQHFLNEVLRLHPPVPINNRVAVRDTTLPVGGGADAKDKIVVRKGEPVVYSVYLMHRRRDLWGEDAHEFRPERWEQRIPAWQFLPFNGGPRICIGQQYALTEAAFVLVRILQQFDAIQPVDRQDMLRFRKGLGLTMWPSDGVRVRLHKA